MKLGLWEELRRDWERKVIEMWWNNVRKKLESIGKVWEMVEMKMCLKSWKQIKIYFIMVLTNYYLRVTPFTNPDVADKLQLKSLKRSQPFRSTIQPFMVRSPGAFFYSIYLLTYRMEIVNWNRHETPKA